MVDANTTELDPKTEFDEEPKDDVEIKEVPEVVVNPAEVAELKGQLAESLKQIEALRSETAVVGKLKELFTGTPEDPKDLQERDSTTCPGVGRYREDKRSSSVHSECAESGCRGKSCGASGNCS